MPPVMIIGVITSASRPISTASLRDLEKVAGRQEIVSRNAEDDAFDGQHDQQDPFVVRE